VEGYCVAARSLKAVVERPQTEKELIRRALSIGQHMFLDAEIQRLEAVSKPIFASAYSAFADQGYLVHREGKYLAGSELSNASSSEELEQRLFDYLPRQRP
jgi:glycerol-3-phosphate O-acyltransferase